VQILIDQTVTIRGQFMIIMFFIIHVFYGSMTLYYYEMITDM